LPALRIAAPVNYGRLCIAPLIGPFLQRHHEVRIDLRLTNQTEKLLKENIDLTIRIGVVKRKGLVAVSHGTSTQPVVASPRLSLYRSCVRSVHQGQLIITGYLRDRD
jgi:DNA-binding transcriptional LysR family regulator